VTELEGRALLTSTAVSLATAAPVAAEFGTVSGSPSVNLSSPAARYVANLYATIFDRTPQADELNYWVNALRRGTGAGVIRQNFLRAASAAGLGSSSGAGGAGLSVGSQTSTAGNASAGLGFVGGRASSAQAFVNSLYATILNTQPDPQGAAFWVNALNRGASRNALIRSFRQVAQQLQSTAGVGFGNSIGLNSGLGFNNSTLNSGLGFNNAGLNSGLGFNNAGLNSGLGFNNAGLNSGIGRG